MSSDGERVSHATHTPLCDVEVGVASELFVAFFITDLLFVTPVLPPQLITQHKNQSDLKPGSTAIFNVTAHGVQPFIYMWFKNGALFDNDKVFGGERVFMWSLGMCQLRMKDCTAV